MLGVGVMIHQLCGGSKHNADEFYGATVLAAKMAEEKLTLTLDSGKEIDIFDDGQSCCESRYMRTDDDLQNLVGGKLIRIEAKDAPNVPNPEGDDWGQEHEVVFVEVATDKGWITISNHNEHNGYYGGFGLTIEARDIDGTKTNEPAALEASATSEGTK